MEETEVYLKASGADEKPDDVRSAIILHCAGPAIIEVFDHFTFAGEIPVFLACPDVDPMHSPKIGYSLCSQ